MAVEIPVAKPQATPAPQPAQAQGSDNIEQKLGIDQIKEADTREIVKTYFEKTLSQEQRAGLIHEKTKTDMAKLRQQIDSLNQRHATADEFVQEIIGTMQKDVLERDLNEGYTDAGGDQPGYAEYFLSLTGTEGNFCPPGMEKYKGKGFSMDWDDAATGEYCVNKVKSVIRSIPPNVKREYRHQYAKEFIAAYAAAIDYYDGVFENFDMGEVTEPEGKLAKEQPWILNFQAWLTQRGMKIEDVTYQYNKLDTKAILDTKTRLEAMKKSLGSYPKRQQDYYTQQIQNIEGYALNNPVQAMDQIAALEKDMTACAAFSAFGGDIKGLSDKYAEFKGKYSDFDPKFKNQIDDLQKKYDDRMKQLDAEKDPQKRTSIMDVANDLKKTRDQIEFDMIKASNESAKKQDAAKAATPEAQPGADAAAAPAEEDKPGFLDQAVLGDPKLKKIVTDLAKNVPLIGGFLLSAFFAPSTLKALGISAPKDLGDFFKANGAPKTPEQLKVIEDKAKKILKDQFDIESADELETMSKTKVKDFLKKKPEKFDQKRYEKFVAALKKNGASDTEDKKVFEYVLLKTEEWKS